MMDFLCYFGLLAVVLCTLELIPRSQSLVYIDGDDQHITNQKEREKRALALLFGRGEGKKWTNNTVPYKFKQYDEASKNNVKEAIGVIERETCVRFSELSEGGVLDKPHVQFSSAAGCDSQAGMSETVIPQQISLNSLCKAKVGLILEKLVNTLGLLPEHQRNDRDQYVKYNESNQEGDDDSFRKFPDTEASTLNSGYDYWSITHLPSHEFGKSNKHPIISTIDPLYQRTIGQRVQLSFNDVFSINKIYCNSKCGTELTCSNGGYQDPNSCGICKCPDGFQGSTCQQLMTYRGEACGGEITAPSDGSVGTIQTPDYPNGSSDFQECTWKISSAGDHVEFWFSNQFGVYCYEESCYHWVEVRYGEKLSDGGPRFCCGDAPANSSNTLVSTSKSIMVIFRACYDTATNSNRDGFRLSYRTV